MKGMRIAAIYRRPKTAKLAPGHNIYSYSLRTLPIMLSNLDAAFCIETVEEALVQHGKL